MNTDMEDIQAFIRQNYASIAQKGAKGCGCGCSPSERDDRPWDLKELSTSLGYSADDVNSVPEDANMGLGCGNPIIAAALQKGEAVLDLGSGGGFDCFLARQRVGADGKVIGVDMTPEMVALARKNAEKSGYDNMDFRLGEIEHLPVADDTVDVIISNCVVNLSQNKQQVFNEAYRVLKHGGRLCISDIVATAQLPSDVKESLAMIAGCIAGAEHIDNLKTMLNMARFTKIKMTPKSGQKQIFDAWVPGSSLENYVGSYIIEAQKD